MKTPTYRDIARMAKVSTFTVSLALRGSPKITAATRQRVRAAAELIGYRPNPLVAANMSYVRGSKGDAAQAVIAYVTDWKRREFRENSPMMRYYRGAMERARELGYKLEVFFLNEDGLNDRRLQQILKARGIEGVALAPLEHSSNRVQLHWDQLAFSLIGYLMEEPAGHRAYFDCYASSKMLYRELKRLGYRRLGLVMGEEDAKRSNELWLASHAWHGREEGSSDVTLPLVLHPAQANRPEALLAWLSRWEPDVVVSMSGLHRDVLRDAGIRIPEEVGFVAINDDGPLEGVTRIDPEHESVGASAIDLVVSQLMSNERGVPKSAKQVITPGRFIGGETTVKQGARGEAKATNAHV